MKTINRNLFIVKPKQPFVDWINQIDSEMTVTLEEIHQDCTVFLVPEMVGEDEAHKYVQAFKLHIFAMELDSWYRDPKLWPPKRTLAMFDKWFDLEYHSMIWDLDEHPIFMEDF